MGEMKISRGVWALILALFACQSVFAASSTSTEEIDTGFFAKRNWGLTYFNYMNGPTLSESAGGSINHYITLKRVLGPQWTLSATFQPDTNVANGKGAFTLGDPYLVLGYPPLLKSNAGSIYGQIRYFYPASDSSKRANLLGIISPRLYAEWQRGALHLTYILIPKIFLNATATDGQKVFSHQHWLQASYDVVKNVSIDFALYPGWIHARRAGANFTGLMAYPGFTVKFNEASSLSPYVEIDLLKTEGKTTSIGASLSYALL